MNSLLYDAEIKYNEDFYSMLAVELFYYLKEVNHHEYDSFFKYIEKRLEGIIQQNNINTNDLENQSKNIINNSGEKSIVQEAIKKLEDIKSKTRNKEYLLGIKLDRTKPKNVMAKLYYIHKSKIYSNYIHSKSYEDLEEIIKTINININDLPSPPSVFSAIKANNPNNEDILEEMNNFLRENLKNQFEELISSFQTLSENLLGRKIRISFIGNISLRKSTVLHYILPIKETECTYRGIIIKHKNIDNYLLFKTKLKKI